MARRDGRGRRGEDEGETTTAEEQEEDEAVVEDGGTPSQSVASSRGWE